MMMVSKDTILEYIKNLDRFKYTIIGDRAYHATYDLMKPFQEILCKNELIQVILKSLLLLPEKIDTHSITLFIEDYKKELIEEYGEKSYRSRGIKKTQFKKIAEEAVKEVLHMVLEGEENHLLQSSNIKNR
jgi:hypothetical protein